MQRERIMIAYRTEIAMRRTTGTHIVFRMHLEEAEIGLIGNDLGVMLWLQTQAGARRQSIKRHGCLPWERREARKPPVIGVNQLAMGRSRSSGSSEPMRSPSIIMVSQVPAGTAFQALPW